MHKVHMHMGSFCQSLVLFHKAQSSWTWVHIHYTHSQPEVDTETPFNAHISVIVIKKIKIIKNESTKLIFEQILQSRIF